MIHRIVSSSHNPVTSGAVTTTAASSPVHKVVLNTTGDASRKPVTAANTNLQKIIISNNGATSSTVQKPAINTIQAPGTSKPGTSTVMLASVCFVRVRFCLSGWFIVKPGAYEM